MFDLTGKTYIQKLNKFKTLHSLRYIHYE